ncbi:MAG: hypothetical protein KDJ52_01300 [Anaerolineae bacterium]|nr:hypothetical protein [Anaerolineae bacterium]
MSLSPLKNETGASQAAKHSDAPVHNNNHQKGDPMETIPHEQIRDNATRLAQRRLKVASDPRSRFVNALTLVSLGVDDG